MERLLVNEYDDELIDKRRNDIDTQFIPFHVSVAIGHSIDFIVRTQSETIDLIEETIQIQVNGQKVKIFLHHRLIEISCKIICIDFELLRESQNLT